MNSTPSDTTPPAELSSHAVTAEVATRAAAMFHPGGYEITGYVLTQKISSWKAIVDVTGTRSMSLSDMQRLMIWKEPVGSGAPPDEEITRATPGREDGEDAPREHIEAVPPSPAAPIPRGVLAIQRPALAQPASLNMIADVEEACGILARRLGCVHNDSVPHNSGWFVPGRPVAYASAVDAIEGLVESLKSGGTVYQPPQAALPQHVAAVFANSETGSSREDAFQQALF
ncbi:hypothetical protein [Burkholderia stagnalis]|uniref:hypothetical protein n=1 Tax=Burkholderia stagnalis TaxID=1503054 RepID=UPI000F573586|nr:hypothetical protein [Burkholderia stagnalis]RQR09926.1 hypothetical protein DF026_36000 [Burkholderia stagnalis]RQR11348.1 hypothetical protein DF025_17450 [Burkholderia stagnalis]